MGGETHPLPRGGTDLMGPLLVCTAPTDMRHDLEWWNDEHIQCTALCEISAQCLFPTDSAAWKRYLSGACEFESKNRSVTNKWDWYLCITKGNPWGEHEK